MPKKKLLRYTQIKEMPNVLEFASWAQGQWSLLFNNTNPIIELACGRGEYSISLAKKNPQNNYIGIDIKGDRLCIGAHRAIEEKINNVMFLRIQIENITNYFSSQEITAIWLTYPDPYLELSRAKKRLTHPRFLRLYYPLLKPQGTIQLKTDSPVLFSFTKKVLLLYSLPILSNSEDNLFATKEEKDDLSISTYYEKLDIAGANKIFYLKFSLPLMPAKEKDIALKKWIYHEQA